MITIFDIYIKKVLSKDYKSLIPVYMLGIKRDFIERISSDGVFYDFDNIKDLQNAVTTLKQKYGKIKIIDKNNLLKQTNKEQIGGKK